MNIILIFLYKHFSIILSLSIFDKIQFLFFFLLFFYFFIKLLIINLEIRYLVFKLLKNFSIVIIFSLYLYIASDNILCENSLNKTLNDMLNKKQILKGIFICGTTIGGAIYLHKVLYLPILNLSADMKYRNLVLEIKKNIFDISNNNQYYLKLRNENLENQYLLLVKKELSNYIYKETFFDNLDINNFSDLTLENKNKVLISLNYIYNINFIKPTLDFQNNLNILKIYQENIKINFNSLEDLTLFCYSHNISDENTKIYINLFKNQIFCFSAIDNYKNFIEYTFKNQIISLNFNNFITNFMDLSIVLSFFFLKVTNLFIYSGNPISSDLFWKSFYRLINYKNV